MRGMVMYGPRDVRIEERLPLVEAAAGYEAMDERTAIKVLLHPRSRCCSIRREAAERPVDANNFCTSARVKERVSETRPRG